MWTEKNSFLISVGKALVSVVGTPSGCINRFCLVWNWKAKNELDQWEHNSRDAFKKGKKQVVPRKLILWCFGIAS